MVWWAILAAAFVLAICGWVYAHRNPYWLLRTESVHQPRERLVRLPLWGVTHPKLRREVKIFNRLHLVLPVRQGVAVVYQQQLAALQKNPRFRPGTDPYERLFYGYACFVLGRKVSAETVRRQLKLNLLWLFAPAKKIVRPGPVVWSPTEIELYPHPRYVVLGDRLVDSERPEFCLTQALRLTVRPSYLWYCGAGVSVKQFAAYYDLFSVGEQTLTLTLAADKNRFSCQICRGTVRVKDLATGATKTYTVRGEQVRLGSSVCAATDALELYLTWRGASSLAVDGGVRWLLTPAEIAANRRVETIIDHAYRAQFLSGEKLRLRFQAARKVVPSLLRLTYVLEITTPDPFWSVLDDLPAFRRAAQLAGGLNLVFLYNGTNQLVGDLVAGFLSGAEVAACRQAGLLLYFVDRTITDPDALYFFSKMAHPAAVERGVPDPTSPVRRSFPVQRTLTLVNPHDRPTTLTSVVPLNLRGPCVVTAVDKTVTATALVSGKVTVYQLPVALNWRGERLTTVVKVPVRVRLNAYEQQTLTFTRREPGPGRQERQRALVRAVSELVITTGDKKLDAVFARPVATTDDPELLALVKAAINRVDKGLLLAVLAERQQLPADVWQFLLTKVVGLCERQGQLHLRPNVNVLGDFTLSCRRDGQTHTFNTQKDLPNSLKHGTLLYG